MSFLEISVNLCGKSYHLVRKNAETHFRCGKILATNKQYPNATAHLILGTEEMIKAFVLLMEDKGFNMRSIKGYRKLFNNHAARHSIIKEFFSVWLFIRSFMYLKVRGKKENKFAYWLNVVSTVLQGAMSGINNHDWWHNADKLKQNCFYTDYNGGFVLPETIDEKVYKDAQSKIDLLITDLRLFIIFLSKATEKQLIEFRQQFSEVDAKGLIEESISRGTAKQ